MSWEAKSDACYFQSCGWQLQVKPHELDSPITVSYAATAKTVPLMRIETQPACPSFVECYTPDNSLVCSYKGEIEDACSLKVRFQITSVSEDRLVLQSTIGFETRSFDLTPTVGLHLPKLNSSLSNTNSLQMSPFSGALILEDQTCEQATLASHESDVDRLQFFEGFLERGVIRKCRFRIVLVSPNTDIAELSAEAELNRLIAEPLPLLA